MGALTASRIAASRYWHSRSIIHTSHMVSPLQPISFDDDGAEKGLPCLQTMTQKKPS